MVKLLVLHLAYSRKPTESTAWRGGRVVYGSGLENRRTCEGTVGSNPTLSVLLKRLNPQFDWGFLFYINAIQLVRCQLKNRGYGPPSHTD